MPRLISRNVDHPAPVRTVLTGRRTALFAPHVVPVAADHIGASDEHGPRTIDLVARTGPTDDTVEAEAATHGIPLVDLATEVVRDLDAINPIGWRRTTPELFGVRLADPDDPRAVAGVETVAAQLGHDRVLVLLDEHTDGPSPTSRTRTSRRHATRLRRRVDLDCEVLAHEPPARARMLHGLRAVVDVAAAAASAPDRACWIVEVAARRLPMVVSDPAGLEELLDPLLIAALPRDISEVTADDSREHVGVRLRRAVVATHSPRAALRTGLKSTGLTPPGDPSVSVLLATNRPERVVDALARIESQTLDRCETIVAVHGGLTSIVRDTVLAAATRPIQLVEVDASATLGTVLNAATERASGQIVTKMDDDDYYGTHHLADLLDALRYSRSTLVAKGAEFVYLAEIDTTIRRMPVGVETASRNLAGGTLMIARDDLKALGGWQNTPRSVDQRLIDDVLAADGRIHRTHGLGFVLNRHGGGHTWDAPVDYFLQHAVEQWPGLPEGPTGLG